MIEYFAKYYYTVPIQIILTVVFIALSLWHFNKLESFKILVPYGLISLVQCMVGVYLNVYDPYGKGVVVLLEQTINVFMLGEFIAFYAFIISLLKHKRKIQFILISVLIIYSLFIIVYWIYAKAFNEPPSAITVIESYLIIIGCLLYFYDLFVKSAPIKILKYPQFWAVTGMLILFAFLLPLTLQLNNIYLNFHSIYNPIYSLNFIGYSILFAFFIISVRCQIKIKTL